MSVNTEMAAFILGAAALTAGLSAITRRQGFPQAGAWVLGAATLFIVVPGWFLVRAAEQGERERIISTIEGFGPVYAQEIAHQGHAALPDSPASDDPRYLAILDAEIRWLRTNPRIADIYTVRRDAHGAMFFLVDSETDYDHDGVYAGEREARTAPGERWEEPCAALDQAFAGTPSFDSESSTDRWGTWVSAFYPMFGERGEVEAVLGIDYPADAWDDALARARRRTWVELGLALVFVLTNTAIIAQLATRLNRAQRSEQALESARRAAEMSNRLKSDFLAHMSHEIRTPLNGIIGMTDLLKHTPLDALQREYLDAASTSADHLLGLVNDVLDVSKIEADRLTMEQEPVSLRSVIGEAELSMRHAAAAKHLILTATVDPGVPEYVVGDPVRIKQVLVNLLSNAVKFTRRGSVRITVTAEPAANGLVDIQFLVTDTGIGIPPDRLPHIFDKFIQGDATTTRHFGGTGLGLTIVYELTRLMSGDLDVTSELGVGSEFRVVLPMRPVTAPRIVAPQRTPMPSEPLRVLIVEDNATNQAVLRGMLLRHGCVVSSAESGAEAVERVREAQQDLVLMDCQMPEMDGYEATERIRALPPGRREVPIWAVTAHVQQSDRQRCAQAGMDGYLPKPVSPDQLADLLRAISERQAATGYATRSIL